MIFGQARRSRHRTLAEPNLAKSHKRRAVSAVVAKLEKLYHPVRAAKFQRHRLALDH